LEVDVENAVTILAKSFRCIETRFGEMTDVETHADARIARGQNGAHRRGIAIGRVFRVVVDREPYVELLHQRLEDVPLLWILRLDDDERDAHQLREFEELSVHGRVERGF